MKMFTLRFLDCCLSDYFQGTPHNVLCVPVDGSTTREELIDSLKQDWIGGDYLNDDNGNPIDAKIDWSALEHSLSEWGPGSIVFPELEKRDEDNEDLCHEGSQAYFALIAKD